MMVMHNGKVGSLTREEFYKLVFNERQLSFIKSFNPDMAKLEEKLIALHAGGKLRGAKATLVICDELYVQPEPEKEAVKNKPQIKTNHRTKNSKHPLPFYLGSNRRY